MGMCVVFVWGIVVDGGVDVLLLSLYVQNQLHYLVLCVKPQITESQENLIYSVR